MAAGDRLYDRMIILPESHYNKLMNEKQEHARFVESVNGNVDGQVNFIEVSEGGRVLLRPNGAVTTSTKKNNPRRKGGEEKPSALRSLSPISPRQTSTPTNGTIYSANDNQENGPINPSFSSAFPSFSNGQRGESVRESFMSGINNDNGEEGNNTFIPWIGRDERPNMRTQAVGPDYPRPTYVEQAVGPNESRAAQFVSRAVGSDQPMTYARGKKSVGLQTMDRAKRTTSSSSMGVQTESFPAAAVEKEKNGTAVVASQQVRQPAINSVGLPTAGQEREDQLPLITYPDSDDELMPNAAAAALPPPPSRLALTYEPRESGKEKKRARAAPYSYREKKKKIDPPPSLLPALPQPTAALSLPVTMTLPEAAAAEEEERKEPAAITYEPSNSSVLDSLIKAKLNKLSKGGKKKSSLVSRKRAPKYTAISPYSVRTRKQKQQQEQKKRRKELMAFGQSNPVRVRVPQETEWETIADALVEKKAKSIQKETKQKNGMRRKAEEMSDNTRIEKYEPPISKRKVRATNVYT